MTFFRAVKDYLLPFFFFLFAILAAFTGGFLARPYLEGQADGGYPLVGEVVGILEEKGWKAMPGDTALQYGMIRGLLQAYDDPYTLFVEPAQAELQSNELEGRFGGIGIRLERDPQNNLVAHPLPGSPAVQAGMLDGDRILSVEDLPVSPATPLDDVQAAIRGPVGQALRLTIARAPDFTPQELLVKRAEVPLPSVTWNPAPGDPATGVIQVNTIAATTPEEIRNAIAGLRALGCDGFVLDLRNNGGGLLDAGVAVARLFLESGTVMTEQYRGEPEKVYPVERAGEFAGLPLVVWINQNTASAAEIIAGALQANGRAKLVGAPSYGKDSIQLVYDLSDGSSLHVTAAHWWLAGQPGNGLAGVGLQPDLPVEDDPTRPGAYLAATRSIFEAR